MSPSVMSKDDFTVARNLLRWVSVGVQPDPQRATDVVSIVDAYKKTDLFSELAPVGQLAEEVRRGVMPSYQNCKSSEAILSSIYARRYDEVPGEVNRG